MDSWSTSIGPLEEEEAENAKREEEAVADEPEEEEEEGSSGPRMWAREVYNACRREKSVSAVVDVDVRSICTSFDYFFF
jgi:hypothetical protein